MMRVVVDGTALCYPLTGIGLYTRSLLQALASERPSWEFVVLAPYTPSCNVARFNVHHNLLLSQGRATHAVGWRAWWFDAVLPRATSKLRPDLFWASTGLAPFLLSTVPVALTVYDFVPERFPQTMARFPRLYRRWNQRHWLARAALTLPISRAIADEARAMFGVQAQAIVYPGVDETFLRSHRSDAPVPASSVVGDYLLVLGTLEPRKNLEALIDCIDILSQEDAWPPGLRVVMAGAKGWRDSRLLSKMDRLEACGTVLRLGYVPPEALPGLLAGARALLMPSLYEGFGMPIAEAMAVGCPIVCSDIAPFREIVGTTRVYWHGTDKAAMVDTYRRLLANLPRPRSIEPAVRFTWPESAKVFVAAVESMDYEASAAGSPTVGARE